MSRSSAQVISKRRNSQSVEKDQFQTCHIGHAQIIHTDCFEWLRTLPAESIDAVVTDPPYGVREYELHELERRAVGGTGIWRIPPKFDGHERSPLPRFTALVETERQVIRNFFRDFAQALLPALKPGAHVFVAGNAFLSQLVFGAIVEGGLEFRTEIVRLVQTLRGGDRPKLGENEFPDTCSLPRGCYEPWGLFRKSLPNKMTVRECLRKHGTGGLRRRSDGKPFFDVIQSERTPAREREIANHPSLKPQSFMRQIVYAALPLGNGTVVDPFMGAGSTIAAAESLGYRSIGVERHEDYFKMAMKAIPLFAKLNISNGSSVLIPDDQIDLPLR